MDEEDEELEEDEEEDAAEDEEEDIVLEEIETEEEDEEEFVEEDNEEEETGEEEIDDEENEVDELDEENEVPEKTQVIEHNELKVEPQAGIREIHIDDIDDDDIEPIRITSPTGQTTRPQMREIPKPEPIVEEKQEKVIVGEAFQKERSINDTIGEHKSEPKLTNSPISSLRATIGLNDRFLFIREIFNNNTEKYNKVIETLDTLDTIQEAVEYLKANLTMQKNEASLRFVELLKRRFTK